MQSQSRLTPKVETDSGADEVQEFIKQLSSPHEDDRVAAVSLQDFAWLKTTEIPRVVEALTQAENAHPKSQFAMLCHGCKVRLTSRVDSGSLPAMDNAEFSGNMEEPMDQAKEALAKEAPLSPQGGRKDFISIFRNLLFRPTPHPLSQCVLTTSESAVLSSLNEDFATPFVQLPPPSGLRPSEVDRVISRLQQRGLTEVLDNGEFVGLTKQGRAVRRSMKSGNSVFIIADEMSHAGSQHSPESDSA